MPFLFRLQWRPWRSLLWRGSNSVKSCHQLSFQGYGGRPSPPSIPFSASVPHMSPVCCLLSSCMTARLLLRLAFVSSKRCLTHDVIAHETDVSPTGGDVSPTSLAHKWKAERILCGCRTPSQWKKDMGGGGEMYRTECKCLVYVIAA